MQKTRSQTTAASPGINPKKQQQIMIIGAIVVVALVAVVALIALSGRTTASDIDFSSIPASRTEDGAFVLGEPDAPITIVEFADYGCPHCQEYKGTVDRIIRELVATGQAKFEFRTFPTAGGALTEYAGRVAECIGEDDPTRFWQAHEAFYQLAMSGQYNQNMGRTVAQRFGVDYGEVLECVEDANQVSTDVALGQRVGVSGTPAVMVRYSDDSDPVFINLNGQVYDRGAAPFNVLQQVVVQAQ